MVVDLSGVTFCDASGLAVLIGIRRRAGLLGGVLRLAAPAPPVVAVLRLTGLDLQFEIFATVLAATSAPARADVPDAGLRRPGHPAGSLAPGPRAAQATERLGRAVRWADARNAHSGVP